MVRYEVVGATTRDEQELLGLARHLNSVNLPNDRAHVVRLLEQSAQSFSGKLSPPSRRKYVFLLRDLKLGQAVGTSSIVAQLGTRAAPYIFLDVIEDEKYSRRLDKHFRHKLLRLGFSYDGPSELAGLVVDPTYRRAPERLGLVISYVRFLFIATHRGLFKGELLAELLPPLEPDGTSHLWEAFGRRFTDMSYSEADRLSSEDKTFIRDLFPSGTVHASLFSPEAQAVIGKVGHQTRGVEKMLRRAGFHYSDRIDPFDGGPHFVADTDSVSLVQSSRRVPLLGLLAGAAPDSRALVARELQAPPYFRGVVAPESRLSDTGVELPADVIEHLRLTAGDELLLLPLDARRRHGASKPPDTSA